MIEATKERLCIDDNKVIVAALSSDRAIEKVFCDPTNSLVSLTAFQVPGEPFDCETPPNTVLIPRAADEYLEATERLKEAHRCSTDVQPAESWDEPLAHCKRFECEGQLVACEPSGDEIKAPERWEVTLRTARRLWALQPD